MLRSERRRKAHNDFEMFMLVKVSLMATVELH
jgi:hypothetical protein